MDIEFKTMKHKIRRWVIKYPALSAAATSFTMPIGGVPGHSYLKSIEGKVNTAFAGVTTPSVKVGHTNQLDSLMAKQNLNAVGYLKGSAKHGKGYCDSMTTIVGSRPMVATFESTAGNLSALSTGELELIIEWWERE